MTGKAAPVRRRKPNPIVPCKCARCQKPFQPRRDDAEFCTPACRQAAHRLRKSNPDLLVARNAFPVDLVQAELATAATISWLNERSIPLGVIFTHTKRTFDAMSVVRGSGAADAVEKYDQGPVGQFLRMLREAGFFSQIPAVREAVVERSHRQRNKVVLSDTKAVIDRDQADWRRVSDIKRLRDSILNGDAWLDSEIAPLPEHRGISVGVPSVMPRPASPTGPKAEDLRPPEPMPDKPIRTSKRWRHG
jgi:hypothetical protein